jgi:hypothetical protein
MMMSMGYEYTAELQPLKGLLFSPQVIHTHGEPWWNDIDMGIQLTLPSQASANPNSKVIS